MNDKDLILPINRIPSVCEFLDILQIKPGGFAGQIFISVYDHFFYWSKDLRVEYQRYYCVEYPTFANFLELAHEIYLEPENLGKAHILKIKSPSGVVNEAYSDNVMEVVIDCLKILEANHEG